MKRDTWLGLLVFLAFLGLIICAACSAEATPSAQAPARTVTPAPVAKKESGKATMAKETASPRAKGQFPFVLREVTVPWGEKKGERQSLVPLAMIRPYLKDIKASPFKVFLIRIQEGYLELVPGIQWKPSYQIWGACLFEGSDGQLWHLVLPKAAESNQLPSQGKCYYAAIRRLAHSGP